MRRWSARPPRSLCCAALISGLALASSLVSGPALADTPEKNLERCMKDARCRAAYFRHKPYKKEDFSDEPFDPETRLELSPEGRTPRGPDGDDDGGATRRVPTDAERVLALLAEDAPEAPAAASRHALRVGWRGAALDGYGAMGLETALTTEGTQWRVGFERNRAQTLRRLSITYLGEQVDGYELADRWWFHAGFAGAPQALSGRWSWLVLRTWLRAEFGAETVFSQFRRDEPLAFLPPETRVAPYFAAGLALDAALPLRTWFSQPVLRDLEAGLEVFADVRFMGVSDVVPRSRAWLLGGGVFMAYSL